MANDEKPDEEDDEKATNGDGRSDAVECGSRFAEEIAPKIVTNTSAKPRYR